MVPKSAASQNEMIYNMGMVSHTLTQAILAVVRASRGKQAKPTVLEERDIYLKLSGNQSDIRYMDLKFFSTKLRKTDVADESYKIEVGDWDIDKNFNEKRVKNSLNHIVVPMLRGDVLEEDHAVLEKVIRQVRLLIRDNAIEYFGLPPEQKRTWRNIIKLHYTEFKDFKVTINDDKHGGTKQVEANAGFASFLTR